MDTQQWLLDGSKTLISGQAASLRCQGQLLLPMPAGAPITKGMCKTSYRSVLPTSLTA